MSDERKREPVRPMTDDEAEAFIKTELDKTAAERAYFEEHRTEWQRSHANKYVLVRERAQHGFFDSFEAAYEEGVRQFGTEATMLIKRVAAEEDTFEISPALLHGNIVLVE